MAGCARVQSVKCRENRIQVVLTYALIPTSRVYTAALWVFSSMCSVSFKLSHCLQSFDSCSSSLSLVSASGAFGADSLSDEDCSGDRFGDNTSRRPAILLFNKSQKTARRQRYGERSRLSRHQRKSRFDPSLLSDSAGLFAPKSIYDRRLFTLPLNVRAGPAASLPAGLLLSRHARIRLNSPMRLCIRD